MTINIKLNKYLTQFTNTENFILNLKPGNGEITWWFLTNLCVNSDSLVFAIDNWDTNEHIFDDNLSNLNKKQQLIKIKNNISDALVDLITKNIYKFNIIYLNVSYDALTVYNDIILLWTLLDDNGILILDEYEYVYKDETLNPNFAIEYFIYQYILQIDVLNKDKQVIIKKNLNKEIKLGLLTPYTKFINNINSYSLSDIYFTIKHKIRQRLSYKLYLSDKPTEYLEELGYDNNYKQQSSRFNVSEIEKYKFMSLSVLLQPFIKYTKINDILYNESTEIFNPYINVVEIYRLLHYNSEMPGYENLCTVFDNNLLTLKKKINFLNCTFSPQPANEIINGLIKIIYPKINTFNHYDVNISYNNLHSKYRTRLHNIFEINETISKFNTKMHLMGMSLTSGNLYNKIDRYLYEKYYTQQLLYCIIFVLQLLKKNGTCILISFSFFTEITIELLYILKKYFKKLVFTKYNTSGNMISSTTKIIASRFKGISKDELDELFKIAEEISTHNNKYDDYNNNYKFINNILDINKNDPKYKSFRAEVIKFNLLNKNKLEHNLNLFNDIVKFYTANPDNTIIEDIIIRKQIQILFMALNKNNLLKIFNGKTQNN